MIYLQLIYEFFKTGLFAVGGGLATLPFLNEICQKYDWFTEQMLADMIAISDPPRALSVSICPPMPGTKPPGCWAVSWLPARW